MAILQVLYMSTKDLTHLGVDSGEESSSCCCCRGGESVHEASASF